MGPYFMPIPVLGSGRQGSLIPLPSNSMPLTLALLFSHLIHAGTRPPPPLWRYLNRSLSKDLPYFKCSYVQVQVLIRQLLAGKNHISSSFLYDRYLIYQHWLDRYCNSPWLRILSHDRHKIANMSWIFKHANILLGKKPGLRLLRLRGPLPLAVNPQRTLDPDIQYHLKKPKFPLHCEGKMYWFPKWKHLKQITNLHNLVWASPYFSSFPTYQETKQKEHRLNRSQPLESVE